MRFSRRPRRAFTRRGAPLYGMAEASSASVPCACLKRQRRCGMVYGNNNNRHTRPRGKDALVMFAVQYEDGRSAYIRVNAKADEYGTAPVLSIAKAQQETGALPPGVILRVQRVR